MPRHKLSVAEKWQIVRLCQRQGWAQIRASQEFNISPAIVSRLLQKVWGIWDLNEQPRLGRPSVTDAGDDQMQVD